VFTFDFSVGALFQCHRIHAISQTARRRPVGKDVPQMSATGVTGRFHPMRTVGFVGMVGDDILLDGLGE